MNILGFIDHYMNLHKYINDHMFIFNYKFNQLFSESVLLEMDVTDRRQFLASKCHFDKIKVGKDDSKPLCEIITPNSEYANDVYILAKAILYDKIGEVQDGDATSLASSYANYENNVVNLYIFNKFNIYDTQFMGYYNDIPKKEVDEAYEKFLSIDRQSSKTITIDMYRINNTNSWWQNIFDIIGSLVGYCRGQYIIFYPNNKEIAFNDYINEPFNYRRYFHITYGNNNHNKKILEAIKYIENKYKINIFINDERSNWNF